MAKVKGMYLRGRMWWLRYTPKPGAKQVRVKLETEFEQVATVKAIAMLHRAPIVASEDFVDEVEEYLRESLEKRMLTKSTVGPKRDVLLAFARECEVTKVSDLSVSGVERWVRMLKEGGGRGAERTRAIKEGTVESYLFVMRAFCGWLVKRNKLRENPAKKVELGKVTRQVRKNFVAAEMVRKLILEAPDDDLRFVLFCGFHAGMRKLEIVEARPHWFQLGVGERRGVISIGKTPTFEPKDRDERTIPISREFEEFLRVHLAALEEDAEFVLKPEKKHRKHRYRYEFKRPFELHMKACGVKSSVHDMRRTFVSLKLIENSSLIFKLAKWTGDDVRVLQSHYGHLLADDADIEAGL